MADDIYRPGQTVAGRYRVVSALSRGGMGAVYLARQVSLDREVALKVILDQGQDPELLKRFDVEARAVCQLKHPNIITYHDYGRDEAGLPFLVMEYLAGYPGSRLVQGDKRHALPDLVHVVSQVCSALHEAHGKGIVHRDLKWSNVMICPESHDPLFAKLIDFGIMKVPADPGGADPLTRTGMILGTPQYMSPEAICGMPVDGRADQYSLAIMLWEAIEGRRPFDEAPQFEILRRQVQDSPPPMTAGLDTMRRFPRLADVLARAMEKHPTDRFETIAAFRDALVEAISSREVTRVGRPSRRAAEATLMASPAGRPAGAGTDTLDADSPAAMRRAPWKIGLMMLVAAVLSGLVVAVLVPSSADRAQAETQVATTAALDVIQAPEGPSDVHAAPSQADATATPDSGGDGPVTADAADALTLRDTLAPTETSDIDAGRTAANDAGASESDTGGLARDAGPPTHPSDPTRHPPTGANSVTERGQAELKGSGTLTLLVQPWAKVSIDGRPVGHSPILEHSLAAGAHRIVLVTPGVFAGEYALTVTIRDGELLTRSVDLNAHLAPLDLPSP